MMKHSHLMLPVWKAQPMSSDNSRGSASPLAVAVAAAGKWDKVASTTGDSMTEGRDLQSQTTDSTVNE